MLDESRIGRVPCLWCTLPCLYHGIADQPIFKFMPLESSIVSAIRRKILADGWWSLKIHGGAFTTAGIPDLICIRDGVTVFLEVKQPGKRPTPIQRAMMARITKEAKVPCFVVTSADESRLILRAAYLDARKSYE